MAKMSECSYGACRNSARAWGLCSGHASQKRRGGPLRPLREKFESEEQRFWSRVVKTGYCWEWRKPTTAGYGEFVTGRTKWRAHRYAWEVTFGPLGGRGLDHKCRNRACVRPSHLQITTEKHNSENRSAMSLVNKTGIRGVFIDSRSGKYYGRVWHNGKGYPAGKSSYDIDEVANAVVALRLKLHANNLEDRMRYA